MCRESFNAAQGVLCANPREQQRHFLCEPCLDAYVCSESEAELGELRKRAARVLCPMAKGGSNSAGCGCYGDLELARALPKKVFELYLASRTRLAEQDLAARIEKEQQAKLRTEVARLAAMDAEQRAVHVARLRLVEEVLALNCPRCKQAFVDFNGCFALTCGRCACGFCAWCLADCGGDAHLHVVDCVFNLAGGTVFSTKAKFKEAQRKRQLAAAVEQLRALDRTVARKVVEACARKLRDLGLLGAVKRALA